MLERIVLHNFRQHESLEVRFTEGVNIIRGPNESGKSTILEALAYNWFGARALRSPMDEVVTFGSAEQFVTETQFTLSGRRFYCRRSPRGAEIYEEGRKSPLVTGQNACTQFIEEQLGVAHEQAHALMFASQQSIRGILEQGDAVSFIEQLIDSQELDQIIAVIQQKVPTGPVKHLREALEEAEKDLSVIPVVAEPEEPDTTELQRSIEGLQNEKSRLRKYVAELKEQYTEVKRQEEKFEQAQANFDELCRELQRTEQQISHLKELLPNEELADADALQAIIAAHEKRERDIRAIEELVSLYVTEDYWDGDYASLVCELEQTEAKVDALRKRISDARREITIAKSQIIDDKVCPTCGQEIQGYDEHNTKLYSKIASLEIQIEDDQKELQRMEKLQIALSTIKLVDENVGEWLDRHSELISEVDTACVPRKVSVRKLEDPDYEALKEAKGALESLEYTKRQRQKILQQLRQTKEAYNDLKQRIENFVQPEPPSITSKAVWSNYQLALEKLEAAQDRLTHLEKELSNILRGYEQKLHEYRLNKQQLNNALRKCNEIKRQLEEQVKANDLIKAIRNARVQIMNQIWNTILVYISDYFSQLRGTQTTITRAKQGFLCDNVHVRNLSGSTLDILGLAIRFALTKLLLPHIDFQLLDEPGAGCDERRTANLMGFVTTADFPQAVVITHHDVDEAAADNLICLG